MVTAVFAKMEGFKQIMHPKSESQFYSCDVFLYFYCRVQELFKEIKGI
jgi:hypothetical protein